MTAPWDVVVVGAGPAGTLAAERMLLAGARVLLFDGGPRIPPGAKAPEPDRRAWGFKAVGGSYDWYRVRAVGGRSLLWGGWCYRFDGVAFARAGWPDGGGAVMRAYDSVEKRLGVTEGTVDARYQRAADELGMKVLPKRGALHAPGVGWSAAASVPAARKARTHHVALHLDTKGPHAVGVSALDLRTEKVVHHRARAVVLAASPIETARILLSSDMDAARWGIGQGYADHMVASYVLLEPEPAGSPDGRGRFPGCALLENFVNLDEKSRRPYRGGFSIELSGRTPLATLGLERMVPGDEEHRWSATQVHAMGEVFPDGQRFVDLHPDERDVLGRSIPRVHVGWSDADREMASDMKAACVAVADVIAVPGSRVVPFVDPLIAGAGHEAGTCRMGTGEDSPCGSRGRLRALDNVWVADASALPSPGDRHPTLTILAHAFSVADDVVEKLAR